MVPCGKLVTPLPFCDVKVAPSYYTLEAGIYIPQVIPRQAPLGIEAVLHVDTARDEDARVRIRKAAVNILPLGSCCSKPSVLCALRFG